MNQDFLQKIKVNFQDQTLLMRAFTHRSYCNEHQEAEHNERLEFLGDAVLELVVTDYLFKTYPTEDEGVLTGWRSAVVKGRSLAKVAKTLDLGPHLKMSKGEAKSGGHKKEYLLANVVEALIGAIYLDAGLAKASEFIHEHVITHLPQIIEQNGVIDTKTILQEHVQNVLSQTPHYELVRDFGPDHQKTFEMVAKVGDLVLGQGVGNNKQEGERAAAREAMANLESGKVKLAEQQAIQHNANDNSVD
jgi:ribonuclease-3